MNKLPASGRAAILVFGVLALLSVFGAVGGRLFSASPRYAQINLTGNWQVSGATSTGASFFCIMNLVHDVSFTPSPAPTPPTPTAVPSPTPVPYGGVSGDISCSGGI